MREIRFTLVHAPVSGKAGGLYLTCRRGKDQDDVSVDLKNGNGTFNSWESIAGSDGVVLLGEACREAMRGAPTEAEGYGYAFCASWAVDRVRGALDMYAAYGWNDPQGWHLIDFVDLPWPGNKEARDERERRLLARGGQL